MLWFSEGCGLFSQSVLEGPGSLVGQVIGRRERLLQVFGRKLKIATNSNSRLWAMTRSIFKLSQPSNGLELN